MKSISLLLLSFSLFQYTFASLNSTKDNVAVYWGQNSIGYLTNGKTKEKELWWYCNWDEVDIILLSFMQDFPGNYSDKYQAYIPTLSFPFHTDSEFNVNKTDTMKKIEKDIKYCQKRDKKILLSLGGQGGAYGFSETSIAEDFGDTLWSMFGEKNSSSNSTIPRPFGDSVIDGFDFDIENGDGTGYPELIDRLQEHSNKSSKKFYYTAAPQCPYPDTSLTRVLDKSNLDMLFIQFYNNHCDASSNSSSFNWETWSSYAKNTSVNSNIQLFLGLPGSINSSSTGYVDTSSELQQIISQIGNDTHFGGVSLWEASLSFRNKPKDSKKSYPQTVKNILKKIVNKDENVNVNNADNLKTVAPLAVFMVTVATILMV